MHRRLILASLALAVPPAAAPSAWASGGTDKPVPLAAKVTTCTTGPDADGRAAVFTGSMPAGSKTRRMQMRFALQQRAGTSPKAPFKAVAVPTWKGWVTSDAGRAGFVFSKRVEGLVAPASYRARITFRWLDAHGKTQRTTTRTTPVCEQPDPRPDLVLAGLDGAPVGKDQAAYTVSVENEGHGDADPFAVTITVGDTTTAPVTLQGLAPGAQATASIAGPRCAPGSTITVTLDPADAVAESDESDDVVQRPCPLA